MESPNATVPFQWVDFTACALNGACVCFGTLLCAAGPHRLRVAAPGACVLGAGDRSLGRLFRSSWFGHFLGGLQS